MRNFCGPKYSHMHHYNSLVPRLPHFHFPFAFTIMYRSGRQFFASRVLLWVSGFHMYSFPSLFLHANQNEMGGGPNKWQKEEKMCHSERYCCHNTALLLVSSPDHIWRAYHFQYNARDTESNPCWGWFWVWDRGYSLTCSWGSIMRGHLRPLVTSTAFSVETVSLGSPSEFHCRISKLSASTLIMLKSSEMGICSSLQCWIHWLRSCVGRGGEERQWGMGGEDGVEGRPREEEKKKKRGKEGNKGR